MPSMTVAEIKTKFSEVLMNVRQGKEYEILYGRNRRPVAKIVPLDTVSAKPQRKLGVLEGVATFEIGDDFKFKSEDEFLGLE